MPGIAVLVVCASLLPDATVLQPVANMHMAPTAESEVVSQAIYGANVALLEQKDGWGRIRTSDNYTGWIPLSALRQDRSYAIEGRVAEVRSLFAHLYGQANVKHAPLLTAPFETRLEVIAEPGDNQRWLQVRLPDDRTAWVQSGDVAFDVKPLSIAEMLDLSKRFVGLPYTWGGTSSFGYDCSGFTQMLCRRRGVNLPRDSRLQASCDAVRPVDREDLAPGDLLYFGSSDKRISHTGLYLGDGKFINATTHETPTVRIDDLSAPYWTRLLVAVRRVK
jgi:SH3-like domain-containing protein